MELLRNAIFVGFFMGTLARILTLKSNYRQYPSYPQGYAVHVVLGAVAAAIGALVIPAVLDGEYTAVSFFALAVQQFREVRTAERDTLENLEKSEIVKRGNAYIEDIAKKFEVRNYLSMLTSFLVSIAVIATKNVFIGVGIGLVLCVLIMMFIKEKFIKEIATVSEEKIYFDDFYLKAGNTVITNVSTKDVKDGWMTMGTAYRIKPNNEGAHMTLYDLGQQQAILHDIISQLGCVNDAGEPWYLPYAKMDLETGSIIVVLTTYSKNKKHMKAIIENCPVLESARKDPKKFKNVKA